MKEEHSTPNQTFLIGSYESHHHLQQPPCLSPIGQVPDRGDEMDSTGGTKAELRKSNKPIMEKRRRARINNCLNDLKGILLEAMRKDPARHSKLEKADILELTVRHLQNVQRNQLAIAMASDPTVLHRFKNGFSECATEVSRYLGRLEIADTGMKTRVSSHLNGCINGLQQVNPTIAGGPTQRFQPPIQPVPHISFGTPPTPPSHSVSVVPPYPLRNVPERGTGGSPSDPNNNKSLEQVQRFPVQPEPSPVHHDIRHHGTPSAFTSIPAQGSFISSPLSTTSSDTLSTSLSSGSDSSSLSFSSDKGNNTSPIDFSIKPLSNSRGSTAGQVRVLKVEPLSKRVPLTTLDKGHMWRPW